MRIKPFSGFTSDISKPERHNTAEAGTGTCGLAPLTRAGKRAICAGVVPQQPPMILTNPPSMKGLRWAAINSGVSSYVPKLFGNPAFGWAVIK
ncbi:hypothetical protein Barb7_02985 [Bacteroidales bacterium Barb7]|nr:hypothetical protein Barb7_02985 [Bacteroidales bacterium Barb7]